MMLIPRIVKVATSSSYESNSCDLMGGTGLLVQSFLAITCILTLIGIPHKKNMF